jgi:hypothetical protein
MPVTIYIEIVENDTFIVIRPTDRVRDIHHVRVKIDPYAPADSIREGNEHSALVCANVENGLVPEI